MNEPRCDEYDYIQFLIATQQSYSCLEAEKVQPDRENAPAHDSLTRLLHRLEAGAERLWQEAELHVEKGSGVLVLDDSTLDKPYAQKMELVTYHWSGKHRRTVKGINLISLLWTDGDSHIPCDYRIYDKANDGLSKNDHFRAMLQAAHERGFAPECVVFDSWYSGLDNLKCIREYGWCWLTQLKANRLVNPDDRKQRPLCAVEITATGTIVYLKGYGLVKVFKIVARNGDSEYWATNHTGMLPLDRLKYAERAWTIEEYHRGIKQFCGIEKAQVRKAQAQRSHIGLSLRAFLRLERFCFRTGYSWFEAKAEIVRSAIRAYLIQPVYKLPAATA